MNILDNIFIDKYGEFLNVGEPKKIKIIHSKSGCYDLYQDDMWKLTRSSPDNIFKALHDLGLIKFEDED